MKRDKVNGAVIDEAGVPVLDADAIELKAEEVIAHCMGNCPRSPGLVSVVGFVEQLHETYGLERNYTTDLGSTKNGHKILGKARLKPLALFVDVALQNDPRFNFVHAHELGHIVLHRRVNLQKTGYADQEMTDCEYDMVSGRKILHNPREWLEWQANRFASAILMPRATVRQAVIDVQKRLGIVNNVGSIVLENRTYSIRDYRHVRNHLQVVYGVNGTNVECRLKDLDILVDRRDMNVRHVSELFSIE